MKLVNYSLSAPEELIAFDELLLEEAETGAIGETLRIWSSDEYFVVLGRACRVDDDCVRGKCRKDGVRIIRRISGGGTVLQGPGCLNFSLVLSYERSPELGSIKGSYGYVLNKIREALEEESIEAEVMPVSDIAFRSRKISGNAQARRRKYFLHHGTLLYGLDPARISRWLRHPGKEPPYRNGRDHAGFIANIPVSPARLSFAIRRVFSVSEKDLLVPTEDMIRRLGELVRQKYSEKNWNMVF